MVCHRFPPQVFALQAQTPLGQPQILVQSAPPSVSLFVVGPFELEDEDEHAAMAASTAAVASSKRFIVSTPGPRRRTLRERCL